ncbi:sugar ABC transporter ATP-binding protein [Xanthomonas rydalmerensis]|uniref:Sugar ABC transporter ATP-binding protein n=1 Tax=Xanthomonas rydalmerensis TaxID=3046274 RepID=A0ABZ0JJ22_9XANT|nr:sugar ABC transporter ATP-binding protein [Xanthomonas sp. DM-2023]WOS39754.1 sugar ABC transporter ATP-binding protein [Xanthomonas sp. DM-2023]WOS43938.1 sugar ABC transporter ATP-binding protein [Xanthomonas sp. DM-2023]WOS48118.1 sugar ABC transporter ATP-binding protein [Xanthomonas sp. DM-2023]WOS52297.1 sugar ABC transporter ATP-binding protein [Xanthomonas sp. DM-2023]WOS56481.1 sugar ABC transporter ATP-binding protein [Xanthomonas sp. DM-2023]
MHPLVLEAQGLSKAYAGVAALEDVALRLRGGEIHALMGQNGAGKSTLIKLLTGVTAADAGRIVLDGAVVAPASPQQAQRLGISTVYQEVNLCPNLSVAENLFAGRYPLRGWPRRIDWRRVERDAEAALQRLGIAIDVRRALGTYPVAVQQMVAIARAVSVSARVLILDEPTSSLDEGEVAELFRVMRALREAGMAILFVTHFLDQVYAVADRISVLRNGRLVGEDTPDALPAPQLVAAMVGRALDPASAAAAAVRAAAPEDAAPLLQAQGLGRRGQLHPTDLQLRRGEVLGLAGLLGAGRTELARLLFGLDRADRGRVSIDGRDVALRGPPDAIAHGLALCPEERKTDGIVAELSVRENIVLALQARMGLRRFLAPAEQVRIAQGYVDVLGIKTASLDTPVGLLSGGNQQKVVLARWLATRPRLLILDEPTRGIDIAAKQDIMTRILALAREGMAVLFISAEVAEIARIADRIAVLRERRLVGELPGGCGERAIFDLIAGSAA